MKTCIRSKWQMLKALLFFITVQLITPGFVCPDPFSGAAGGYGQGGIWIPPGQPGSSRDPVSGGGNYKPPPPPPPEVDSRVNEAGEAGSILAGQGESSANGAINMLTAEEGLAGAETAGNRSENDQIKNGFTNTSVEGDPVLVSSGRYVLEAEDYQLTGSSFGIGRKYISEEKIVGSMGAGWISTVDSRIMRGWTRIDPAVLAQAQAQVNRAARSSSQLRQGANDVEKVAQGSDIHPRNKGVTAAAAAKTAGQMRAAADSIDAAVRAARAML